MELRAREIEAPLVIALPRGGVPVGYEIARAVGAPLDIWMVRKIGVPWDPELGMGAVAEGGRVEVSGKIISDMALSEAALSALIETKRRELDEAVRRLRGEGPRPAVRNRTVIVADDGVATGATARAVVRAIREESPKQIVLAVPVASPEALVSLGAEVDEVVVLLVPKDLISVGSWYADFTPVSDDEVRQLLDLAQREQLARTRSEPEPAAAVTPSSRT